MKKVYKTNIKNDLTTFKGMPDANVLVLGGAIIGDGNGASYYWNDTSTATHDGDSVIQVTGVVVGRWIKLAGGVDPTQFIQNQNSVFQPANYKIDGTGETGFLKTSGALSLPPNFSEIGRGVHINNTITATNHVQELIGIDLNSTYNLGAFGASAVIIPLRITAVGSTLGEMVRLQHDTARLAFVNGAGSTPTANLTASIAGGLVITSASGMNTHLKVGNIDPPLMSLMSSRRIIMRTAGTYNDDDPFLDVQGTTRHTGSVFAISGTGRANIFNSTGVATANNDKLIGVDINTTFNPQVYTGVLRFDLRTANNVNLSTTNGSFTYIGFSGSSNFLRLDGNALFPAIIAHDSAGSQRAQVMFDPVVGDFFCDYLASAGGSFQVRSSLGGTTNVKLKVFNTGNTVIQNGGTYTDGGERLQVAGVTRIYGGGETLKVGTVSGGSDFAYIGLYARQGSPTTRSGRIGYLTTASTLTLENTLGQILINTTVTNSAITFLADGVNSNVTANAARFGITPSTGVAAGWTITLGTHPTLTTSNLILITTGLSTLSSGSRVMLRTNSGGLSPSATLNSNTIGEYSFGGYGTTYYDSNKIIGLATENWSATAGGSKLEFYTTPNTTLSQVLALTIDQDQMLIGKNYRNTTAEFTGTIINFTGVGSKYQTISADTNYTMSNTAEGIGVDIMITASGANRTISIAGVTWKGAPSLVITAGNTAWIFLKQINGTVWGTFVQ